MQYGILDAPDFAMLKVRLEQPGEKITAESGALVAMGPSIEVQTSMRGGLLAAAKRKMLGGESIFQNTYIAQAPDQDLFLSAPAEGDMRVLELGPGQEFFLQSGAYVAHIGDSLQLDTQWGGVKSFFSGVGFFMLRVVGPGTLFYAAYGAIHEVQVNGQYTCDTGHIVGFGPGLTYGIRKFGGFKGLFFSGEGLVCGFEGTGSLLLQTRNPASLASFLQPFRPVNSRD
ncbi:MAG: hypothetical protein RJA70_920 [Pseudomonadota bacterium]|jgi:uncharacterized protein (TIGR00266 family)